MIDKTKPLILVDGSSYLFRAFHALPPLTNSKGQPTGAIYGVINMLKKLISDYDPHYVAVVFDPKGKTFRNDMYPEYKANRKETPEDLVPQIEPLLKIIQAMGFPLIIKEGVEADDVIGTLAVEAEKVGLDTIVSTSDKDMAQLVNGHVSLINTMTGKAMDREGVKEKFGVPPELIIDYLTLMGDTSDNIPGVPMVGPKTAAKWLNEYGSLDNIVARADEIKGKVGENLRDTLDQLPLSKKLVTIKLDVPLDADIDQLTMKSPNTEKLIEWFSEFEFKAWLKKLLDESEDTTPSNDAYHIVTDQKDFDALLKRLQSKQLMALDTETDALHYADAHVVGISIALEPNEAFYIPFAHDYDGAPAQLDRNTTFAALKSILEDPDYLKVGQNLKFDMSVLTNHGIHLKGVVYDTMLESYTLNSTANRHDLDTLSLKYLGRQATSFEDVAGKGAKQVTFNKVPLEKAGPYAAEDADLALQLHQTLFPLLKKEKGPYEVYKTIEIPLVPILSEMERHGVLIDPKKLQAQSQELGARIDELEKETYAIAGESFNLNSPKQLQEILFVKLGLPINKKTPGGQPSTAEAVLQDLALDYPLPKVIMEYRSLSKLKSTYTDKLPELIHSSTGRIHTSYHQAVTATGRLSSSDPNLQNIPVRSKEGRRIRQAFIAPPKHKIVAFDYSQIELRIMAHLSGDESLVKAFQNNHDIHQATAAEVFNVSLDDVTPDQRRDAKVINFGLLYGMSAYGLSRQLGTGKKDAQAYIDMYFDRYPGVKKYIDSTKALAAKNGFVETLYGRRLYLPEINSSNVPRRHAAERTAINAPMQGTAADIIKLAMIAIDDWLKKHINHGVMIMQVHDELVFEIPESSLDDAIPAIREYMLNATHLCVPLDASMGIGDNWEEAH